MATRKERRAVNKLLKMYMKNLDNIYNTCEKTAKAWETDKVPLTTLRAVIDVVKKGIENGMKDEQGG